MCAEPSPLQRTDDLLAAGDRAASAGRWLAAEAHWRDTGSTRRLEWLDVQRERPRHRHRASMLWGVALGTSGLLTGILAIGTSATPVAVISLSLTSTALVAMLLAALATGRWLDGTGTRPAFHPQERP